MKKRVSNDLILITSEIEYYKNKKDIIKLLTRINSIINPNSKNLLIDIIEKINNEILNDNFKDETKLEKIEKIIYGFLLRNERAYIKKIIDQDYIIYEYKKDYEIYIINKNINLVETIKKKFDISKIVNIELDNVKWNNIINIMEEDIKTSKNIKITINK